MPKRNPKRDAKMRGLEEGHRLEKEIGGNLEEDLKQFDPSYRLMSRMTKEEIKQGFEESKMLATLSRQVAETHRVMDWYEESLAEVESQDDSANHSRILNQMQFRSFVARFELKINDAILALLRLDNVDFFLHAFYIGFHELQLASTDRTAFYFGLKLLLKKYPFFTITYDKSHNRYEELKKDKFCFKDFITFQELCKSSFYLDVLKSFSDFIENIHLPKQLDQFQDGGTFSGPADYFFSIMKGSIDFIKSTEKEHDLYLKRIRNEGNPAWSSSSFLERMYFNMVFAATDPKMPVQDHISPGPMYLFLKSIEDSLKRDFGFSAIEITSIITSFFDLFNDIYKSKAEKKEKGMFFCIISKDNELNDYLIPRVQGLYESGCIFSGHSPSTTINWLSKIWHFLDRFSLKPDDIDVTRDLFLQEKIPFAMEFHNKQYFVSSVQFMTAFGEFIHRYGLKSGQFAHFAGRRYEEQVENIIEAEIELTCTRVKLQGVKIGKKTETDIDIVAFFEGFLFLFECKAYSRINYKRSMKMDEIEENWDDLKAWLDDIDNIAKWITENDDHMTQVLEKVNSKLARKKLSIEVNDIHSIVPGVITIAPEFLLNYDSVGWFDEKNIIPRCCTYREIGRFFKSIKQDGELKKNLRAKPFVVSNR